MTTTTTIGVVMDPIETIKPHKDTSLLLMLAAQAKGWKVHYIRPEDMYLDCGQARSIVTPVTLFKDNTKYYEAGESFDMALGELNVILMRKDPPFNTDYVYNTYLLEAAERDGALVVNRPQSLRDCNEKLFATHFPQCCPPLLVSANAKKLREFHQQQGDVIFKPLDGMGGSSIFRCKQDDPNVGVILETLTDHGRELIMAQSYLPQIVDGDKRVLVINGKPVPYCLARIPAKGETRGNLAAGGRGEARPLSDRDRWIAEEIGPTLVEKGLLFVGLDIIGDHLTEINVTSPTCAREIDDAYQTDIGGLLMDAIAAQLETQ